MRDGWLEAETLETLRAATPKFEAKRHGASDHSNNCRLVPLANILPQTLQALLEHPQGFALYRQRHTHETSLRWLEHMLAQHPRVWTEDFMQLPTPHRPTMFQGKDGFHQP